MNRKRVTRLHKEFCGPRALTRWAEKLSTDQLEEIVGTDSTGAWLKTLTDAELERVMEGKAP
jgi:hypothetical protein